MKTAVSFRSRIFSSSLNDLLKEKNIPWLFLAPTLAILFVITIFPTLFALYTSFTDYKLGEEAFTFVGLNNYKKLISDPLLWYSFQNTIIFTLATTSLEFSFGLGIALMLNKDFKGKRIIRSIIFMPMMVTPIVAGILWLLMFQPDFSIINYFLSTLGIEGPGWLIDARYAMLSIIIADVWQWTPFFVLIFVAGFSALPIEPLEAAEIDGASRLQRLRYISLPMLKSLMAIALLMRMMDSFKTFDLVFVITRGGPGMVTETLSLYIFRNGLIWYNLGYAAALSFFALIIFVIASRAFLRLIR